MGGRLCREVQALVAQPQPHAADRAADREAVEDRGDNAGDRFVGMPDNLTAKATPASGGRSTHCILDLRLSVESGVRGPLRTDRASSLFIVDGPTTHSLLHG